jgi:hypothetical protein
MSQRGDFSKKKNQAFAVMVSSSEWLIGVVTNERHDFSLATPLPNQMNHFFIGEIKVGILIALKQGNGATVNLATRGWIYEDACRAIKKPNFGRLSIRDLFTKRAASIVH